MLTFLTGTYFSAKKEYIYEKICRLLENGEKVYLIVPEQSSFDRDRDFLFTYGEKTGNLLTVTSFTHLSRDVLEEYGLHTMPEADDAARNVIMSLAVEELSDSLEIFRRYSSKLSLVSRLLGEYEEIKQSGTDTDEMIRAASNLPTGKLKKKLCELAEIFSAYEAMLGNRFSEKSNSIAVMTEFLRENKIFSGSYIFFDDFRGFTGAQIKLMSEMISQSKDSFISVFAPDSVSSFDSEAYLHAVNNCRKIRNALSLRGVGCSEEKITSSHPAASHRALSDSLFCAEKEIYEESTDNVTVISAGNKYSECDTVALQIKKLLDEEGYRCRDISITERDAGYLKTMVAALKKYGIPVFEDKRVPLFDYPLIKAVLAAVEIAAYGFSADTVFAYIKTGITGISAMECAGLENYVYIWNIDRNGWLKPFSGHPEGFGEKETPETVAALSQINSVRERIIAPLLSLKRKLDKGEGETSCRAVFEFLTEINAAENFRSYADFLFNAGNEAGAVECAKVWDTLVGALDALFESTAGRSIKPARFFELIKIILSSADVGRIPAGIDEIIIGSAGRTRHLEPRAVFVLGCNDGVFPRTPTDTGLFSSAERRILCKNEIPLENISENMYSEERMIAYSVLTLPLEKLFVSYSRMRVDGQETQPSEIVSEIRTILPGCREIDDRKICSFDKIGSIESAFEECALNYRENTVYSASLKKFISVSPLKDRFAAVVSAAEELPFEIKDDSVSVGLFGKDMYVSPSKAEAFHNCAFRYFCQYGLGISKPRPADLDARINGLLIHDLLENILLAYPGKKLLELSDEMLRSEISRITEEFIGEYMGGRADKSVLLNRSLDKTKDTAYEILMRMKSEFAVSRFETVAVELQISNKGDVSPYKICLPDGGSITVGGQVDRVDIMKYGGKAYLRVVDYKTGGKDFKLGDVFQGLNMQMLIYLMCLWDNGKELYGDIVPAGILYVPANNSGKQLPRNASGTDISEQRLVNGRMNGMILGDDKVIDGMEEGRKGHFINVYYDRYGKLQGKFLSLEGFRLLHEKIDSILCEMGEKLHTGEIAAVPVIGPSYEKTCVYCDFRDICRRSDDGVSKSPSGLSHEDAIRLLKGE